ncbi:hypothetical protein [Rhodopirellula europaea]|uniref:hypothetical protein n=1 Tax=Rhodopirellula europaea TaxID=1263866 RepID=UPI003D2BC9EE|tara:strand:- start:1113 stop:1406 length:294 start_codon:yes stop_codon:yes gene_type:complete
MSIFPTNSASAAAIDLDLDRDEETAIKTLLESAKAGGTEQATEAEKRARQFVLGILSAAESLSDEEDTEETVYQGELLLRSLAGIPAAVADVREGIK